MDSEQYLSTYDSQVLRYIEGYSIFNDKYDKLEQFLNTEDTENFEQSTQFILLYDDNNKIVYSKDLKIIPTKDDQLIFDINIIKYLYYAYKIRANKKVGSRTKFEKLKHEKLKNIVDLNPNIAIIILDIPSKPATKAKELHNILKYYLDAENDSKKSLFNLQNFQLFSVLSVAIIITTTLKVVNIMPIQVVNEAEIILALKMIVAVFSPFICLYFILIALMMIPYFADFKHMKFFLLSVIYKPFKKIFVFGVLVITSLNILGDIYPNKKIKNLTDTITLPFSTRTANWYLKNKVSLVYDKNIQKPILLLGVKDGLYYYDDEFANCKLQQKIKDLNLTKNLSSKEIEEKTRSTIKNLLLHIDTNSSETYREYNWKVASIKDMQFDYNITLINESILQCNDENKTK